jgi:hypothetical protein
LEIRPGELLTIPMEFFSMPMIGEFFCAELKRSLASMLPWDIPWHDPSHAIFFIALYSALSVIGLGVLAAILITMWRLKRSDDVAHETGEHSQAGK